jgi:hypothetical protein
VAQDDPFSMENNDNPVTAGESADDEEKQPNLLDMEEEKAAKRMYKEWNDSRKYVKRHIEQWKVNQARTQGFTGVRLVKVKDEQQFYAPMGAVPSMMGMNKGARLKRRVRAHVFADKPHPHVEPATNTSEGRDQAEFSTRALMVLGGEGELNIPLRAAHAFDLAGDYGSGFLKVWVNDTARQEPVKVQVRPGATSLEDAYVDPMTGLTYVGDLVDRYLTEDDQLTEDVAEAKLDWVPGMDIEYLTGKHVRFIPHTAEDVWDAEGVQIGAMVPLGRLKSMFPEIRDLDDEELQNLVGNRPAHSKDLMPVGQKDTLSQKVKDEAMVFVLTRFHRSCYEYPKGAYLIACSDDKILYRGEWWDDTNNLPLDIPVSQFKQFFDEDNPYGKGIMEFLGPGNEIRAQILGTMLEHMDRFRNRKTFIPLNSNLQAKQLQSPTATAISIAPGGQPFYEEFPDFPQALEKFFDFTTEDLNDESTLQETAQGLAPASVRSGKQGEQIIAQTHVGLSDLRDNTERGLIRVWRIMLQQARAFYTVPQRIAWVGEDGQYKEKNWMGADLGNATDVRLARGSFTMLPPEMKAQQAAQWGQMGLLQQQQAISIVMGNVGPQLGIQDEPHRQRVRRQISQWENGPPEGFSPINPQTGQPQPNPLFLPLPVDEEPPIAALRAYELGNAVSGLKFLQFDPGWQQGLVQEYMRMRRAAGIMTVQEQQQMQQQMAQQQEKGVQTTAQAKVEEAKIKAGAETEKSQIAAEGGLQKAIIEAQSGAGTPAP